MENFTVEYYETKDNTRPAGEFIRRISLMGKNFRETLDELLRDPEFKAEWDALEPEQQIMRTIIEGREERDLTQKQLAGATGITQTDISRTVTEKREAEMREWQMKKEQTNGSLQ